MPRVALRCRSGKLPASRFDLSASAKRLDALEAFHPDRMASRILGMGDVLSLVEEIEGKVEKGQGRKAGQES